jgi:polysaccharide deacetylase 2 family uncharacterized protein YibQ
MAKKRRRRAKRRIWPWLIISILLVSCGYLIFSLIGKGLIEKRETVPEKKAEKIQKPPTIIASKKKEKPRIAIIIDDLGYDIHIADDFLKLGIPLTYSILPFTDYGKLIAEKARLNGQTVMLHLPMEAENFGKMNPKNGFLFVNMDRETLLKQLIKDLHYLPYIDGVNNHMGSRFTRCSDHMRWVLSELKERHLFFVDSMTTSSSKGFYLAREMGVRTAQRDVFLDNVKEPSAVKFRIRQLVDIAKRRGFGIGIGHPDPATYRALQESIAELVKEVELVAVSELVN